MAPLSTKLNGKMRCCDRRQSSRPCSVSSYSAQGRHLRVMTGNLLFRTVKPKRRGNAGPTGRTAVATGLEAAPEREKRMRIPLVESDRCRPETWPGSWQNYLVLANLGKEGLGADPRRPHKYFSLDLCR